MSGPLVTFENVTKSFDGRSEVVKALDLAINDGEFITLLGPSGSGKTTILMMLAGFEDPTSGIITLDGRRLDNIPAHKRGIGVVFQNYALFPHMSVAENIAFALEMQGVGRSEREQRVRESMALVHLGALKDRLPSQLSGGQQQRVALARALIFKPRLVLMDEPLGALDKQLREQMQHEIRTLHRQLGVTFLCVTHDQGEALTMSDRIAVLHEGQIQQLGTPQAIYNEPANAFVASFIGENNGLNGVVQTCTEERCHVRLASGKVIVARVSSPRAPGSNVMVSVRPELVHVRAGGQGAIHDNTVEARIEELVYFGDHTRLRLSSSEAPVFLARLPASHGAAQFSVGQSVTLSWHAKDCRVIEGLA